MCLYLLQVVNLNYGMEDKNLIDYVYFYKKDDLDKVIKIDKEKV